MYGIGRPTTAASTNNNTLTLQDAELDDDDEELPSFRSSGTLNSGSNSRARMLAQQRELQLKKRQNQIQTGGMVRSSIDTTVSAPSPAKSDGQFTPAIRQFSAPKALRESTE